MKNAALYQKHILVIDDEPVWANRFKSILNGQGYKFVDVQYGVTRFADIMADYDLAVVDIKMPRYDGFQVKNYLKTRVEGIKIVLTSQYETFGLELLDKAKGADAWIEKKELDDNEISFIVLIEELLENDPSSREYAWSGSGFNISGFNIIVDKRNMAGINTIDQIGLRKRIDEARNEIENSSIDRRRDALIEFHHLILELCRQDKDKEKITNHMAEISDALHVGNDNIKIERFRMLEATLRKMGVLVSDYKLDSSNKPTKVFVVHGHDEALKEKTSRFIEKLGITAIVLNEQPDAGQSIIEKFEYFSGVQFAIVLLTPDDIGGKKGDAESDRPRARQNVVFELGYLMGRLGRNRVCALHCGDVEMPSDLHGVLFTEVDEAGAWKFKIAQELRNAGFSANLNML
jgi:predicted nucleotide-binding protein/ActR/RegA family two-component response regulator